MYAAHLGGICTRQAAQPQAHAGVALLHATSTEGKLLLLLLLLLLLKQTKR
jgi:hypothetical protein